VLARPALARAIKASTLARMIGIGGRVGLDGCHLQSAIHTRLRTFAYDLLLWHGCWLQMVPSLVPHARWEEQFMRRTTMLLAAAAAAAISTSSAQATMRISGDPGGLILRYAERFLQARASGEQVVIDGACLSACTLAVAMLPRSQVCATSNAVLGFHAAWRPTNNGGKTSSSVATQAMMELYPADVRSWIGRHGGLTSRIIYLRGGELAAIVPTCGGGGGGVTSAARSNGVGRAARQNISVARAREVRPGQPRATLASQQIR
jgi:hypothetical protein